MKIPKWALERIQEAERKKSTSLRLIPDFNGDFLTEIPLAVFELTELVSLELDFNRLASLPESIAKLRKLRSLDLRRNQFTDLSESITKLQNLTSLNLGGNQLTVLPESITKLQNLTSLDLSRNQLANLPDSIKQLQNLTSLDLSNNQFTRLPEPITKLQNLANLNLIGNLLTSLPESIDQLQNLISLDLGSNQFTNLPESITKLQNLTSLDLGGNQFTNLPESITKLQNLTSLDLGGNQFANLPEPITKLQKLTNLNLSGNRFTSLPDSIAQLQNLMVLFLADNQFTTLPESVTKLQKLTELALSANQIKTLPESIGNLEKLNKIFLNYNPLVTPPLEVARSGRDAIRRYFRQLNEEGQDHLFEAKLLILGEGGAGKTTLAKKIENSNYVLQDEKTTEGVDVLTWSFPINGGKSFRVNIWDFGGQEIYHATHQFFLTKRSLYILVADTRKEDTDFYYWLNVVELLTDNSPLLIIKNEKQDRHRDLNERQLRGQFENLKEVFATNLETNRGLEKVKDEIKHYIKNLPHIGSPLPKTWIRVRERLENDPRNYISLEEYFEICRDNGFSNILDSLQLSNYLNDIGVFLHFQDEPSLKKVVILKPKWGTDAVYKVLDNKVIIKNLGRFTFGDLEVIWDAPEYNSMHYELLQLMMKFKLCYEIPAKKGHYIAPQLLTENQSDYEWNERDNLLLRYTYEFMPKGILLRFVVVMSEYIWKQTVWKTGVVLEKDKTRAEVIELYGKRQIHVRVAGAHKKELMTIVVHELDQIHDAYRRLKYDKLIPCNCKECRISIEPHFFRNEQLQNFIEKRLMETQCGVTGEMVNVRSLIDDIIGWKSEKEVEEIMSKQKRSASDGINVGDNFSGTIITGTVKNSFNKIESANVSGELKDALKQLVQAVEVMKISMPEGLATETAENLEKLVEEATKESPKQKWYSVSIDGLIKAAENLDKLGEPVIKLSRKVLSLLTAGVIK